MTRTSPTHYLRSALWCGYVLALTISSQHVNAAETDRNTLAENPSPYLALHSQDPVHWQSWSKEVIAKAKRDDKLIFVSIGYFSCHWCHVMQRESYQDEGVAKLLNEHFIAAKVDRELQPALDAHLIKFVEATLGHAGWPLNVFLTPDGHPLLGMTYLPRDQFAGLLDRLSVSWTQDSERLKTVAKQAAEFLADAAALPASAQLNPADAERLVQAFTEQAFTVSDRVAGGFGQQTKFPAVPQLRTLLRINAPGGNPDLDAFLRLTLRQMSQLGLRDHLGGGFFRYSTDPNWHVPHFEKMLYDNALLADLYLRAADQFADEQLRGVGLDTVNFMLSELWREPGGFISSLSAVDDQDVEGGYYLWRETALAELLSAAEFTAVRAVWGLDELRPLEAGYLPLRRLALPEFAKRLGTDLDAAQALLDAAHRKLFVARKKRNLPRDDKLLAGWNGLALSALARAAGSGGDARVINAGRLLRHYLVGTLWTGSELLRAKDQRGAFGSASLEDYAYVARGLFDWSLDQGQEADLGLVTRLINEAWQRFHSPKGWQLSEGILIPYSAGETIVSDGALPSPSAMLLELSLEVAYATGNQALYERAVHGIRQAPPSLRDTPYYYASQLQALMSYSKLPAGGLAVTTGRPVNN